LNLKIKSSELTIKQFDRISSLLYDISGISLHEGKMSLVKSRLLNRLMILGLSNFEEYVDFIERDSSGKELIAMVDILTTNQTSFFREPQHFEFLKKHVLPSINGTHQKVRIWCAGCSSGEEPYSLAILLQEENPQIERCDVKILATDISVRVLKIAEKGIYSHEQIKNIQPHLLLKYFTRKQENGEWMFCIKDNVKSLVRIARLSLVEGWPMKGPFHFIFCRNVMIYFDQAVREKLVERFYSLLIPGGHLFIGHSESLTGLSHKFTYVAPAVFRK
jgi:chemotaxis protein methyltransferase CheR